MHNKYPYDTTPKDTRLPWSRRQLVFAVVYVATVVIVLLDVFVWRVG